MCFWERKLRKKAYILTSDNFNIIFHQKILNIKFIIFYLLPFLSPGKDPAECHQTHLMHMIQHKLNISLKNQHQSLPCKQHWLHMPVTLAVRENSNIHSSISNQSSCWTCKRSMIMVNLRHKIPKTAKNQQEHNWRGGKRSWVPVTHPVPFVSLFLSKQPTIFR